MSDTEGPIESISESTRRTLEHQAGRIKELLASLADMEASRDEVARSASGFAEAAAIQVQVADRLQARLFATEARLQAAEAIVDEARFVIEQEQMHVVNPDDDWWRTKRPFWMYRLREAVRGLVEDCPSCKPDGTHNINFDRTLCACGAMHYYCNECGRQTDPCDG